MQQRHTLIGHSTGGRLPVIIGEDDTGETSICWVAPQSGSARITFSDERAIEKRLGMAGVTFRLSPEQLKLTRLIVRGFDSSAAAERLGVSPNTTRTQLRRIYDKTGVHTQSALVQVILSVGTSS